MLPYRSFNAHLRERFGVRVQRIGIDAGFTCPNIDGTRGRGGCLFCDAAGSLAGYQDSALSIEEQIARGIERLGKRTRAGAFIAYFQSFTATREPPERLAPLLERALAADPRIAGLAVGARPDCLAEPMLDLLESFHRRTYLWIDAGLETPNDETLRRINRRCTTAEFADSMRRAKARGLLVCAHIIFGLPGDGPQDRRGAIDLVNALGLDGVKIHNLYIDAGAPMANLWRRGQVPLPSREEYADWVCEALARLRPEVLIHRLTGEAPRSRHLAPDWAADKNATLEAIRAGMIRRGWTQGALFGGGA